MRELTFRVYLFLFIRERLGSEKERNLPVKSNVPHASVNLQPASPLMDF